MPPDLLINIRIETFCRPMVRAMRLTGSRAWCMSQIRSLSSSVIGLTPQPLIDELSVRQSGLVLR
jgi:hypothetical protein